MGQDRLGENHVVPTRALGYACSAPENKLDILLAASRTEAHGGAPLPSTQP